MPQPNNQDLPNNCAHWGCKNTPDDGINLCSEHLPNSQDKELRENIAEHLRLGHYGISETKVANSLFNLIKQREYRLIREAEARGAAFAIQTVDHHHINRYMTDTIDRIFKSIKNDIRSEFEAITGVDPAPNYPIVVELTKQEPHE